MPVTSSASSPSPLLEVLAGPLHLACVEGPDRGMVSPLTNGTIIGRDGTVPLTDPALSRHHCQVVVDRRLGKFGFLRDLSPTNSSRRRLLCFSYRTRSARGLPCSAGARFVLGSGLWVVRPRPRDLTWPHPPLPAKNGASRTKILRWSPLLFVAFALWRFLPDYVVFIAPIALGIGGAAAGILAVRRRQRRQRFDGAHLLLVLLAARVSPPPLETRANGPSIETRVWLGETGRRVATVSPRHRLGFVGPDAHCHAQWVAAQILLHQPHLTVIDDLVDDHSSPSHDAPQLRIRNSAAPLTRPSNPAEAEVQVAWAASIEGLPPEVNQIVSASDPVGTHWLRTLVAQNPQKESVASELPTDVSLTQLGVDLTAQSQRQRWQRFHRLRSAAPPRASAWAVPIGLTVNADMEELEAFSLDLPTMGPHALLAGGTGSGKSVALRTWLSLMALYIPPTALRMVLIDYKGGSGLGDLQGLPHIEQFHTDIEPAGTAWLLGRLRQILHQRKEQLLRAGYRDIAEWERQAPDADNGPPARLLVVIDEFQALSEEHPQFLSALSRLASQGRSLGLHLVLATQRPGPAITADLRGTIDLRIALRCTEKADSLAIIGDGQAANLPRLPGRALCDGRQFQFAQVEVPPIVSSVKQAADDLGMIVDGATWPTPLPQFLERPDIRARSGGTKPALNLGVFEPQSAIPQSPSPLLWAGSPLLLAGPPSTRTELAGQALSLAAHWGDLTDTPIHLVAAQPQPAGPWTSHISAEACGDVALLLSHILDHGPATLVVIDIAAVLAQLETCGVGLEAAALWLKILTHAESRRITIIATDTEGHPRNDRFSERLLRLPNESAWMAPSLVRILPSIPSANAGPSSSAGRILTREELTSAIAGRFLATGLADSPKNSSGQVVPAQLFPPTFPERSLPHDAAQHPTRWRVANAEQILPAGGLFAGASLSPANIPSAATTSPVLLIGGSPRHRSELQRFLASAALSGADNVSAPSVEHIPTDQWVRAIHDPLSLVIAIDPPLELIRFLAQRHPSDALWLRAHFPYPQDTGIGRWNHSVQRISLPTCTN